MPKKTFRHLDSTQEGFQGTLAANELKKAAKLISYYTNTIRGRELASKVENFAADLDSTAGRLWNVYRQEP